MEQNYFESYFFILKNNSYDYEVEIKQINNDEFVINIDSLISSDSFSKKFSFRDVISLNREPHFSFFISKFNNASSFIDYLKTCHLNNKIFLIITKFTAQLEIKYQLNDNTYSFKMKLCRNIKDIEKDIQELQCFSEDSFNKIHNLSIIAKKPLQELNTNVKNDLVVTVENKLKDVKVYLNKLGKALEC